MQRSFAGAILQKGYQMSHIGTNGRAGWLTRRDVLAGAAGIVGTTVLPAVVRGQAGTQLGSVGRIVKNGRIKQSICGGCLRKSGLDKEQTARLLVEMGLVGRDLVGRNDWDVLKKYDLVATMVPGAGSIKQGLNDKSMHAKFMEDFKTNIKAAAEYKWPNVICMAGDRKGIGEEEGMDNCQMILKEAVKIAEDSGVTLCMEMLNSKVNHPGYMCDNYPWAFELCHRVDSPRFKMLFDIYHMQIMEGDLIATIKKNIQWIGHFHTAGVPGRHELDENQEIYYPAVMRAIVETGYQGYVAHEYSPVRDAIPSLVQAVTACDV
jgi:hydroxypyruvate isomerase